MILLLILYSLISASSGQDIAHVSEEPFAADVPVFGCKSPEYVKINSEQGIIHCTFPPSFKAVFWYDNVFAESDVPVLEYYSLGGRKSGEGYSKGDYDVTETGSLVIKKVTLKHEKSFKVICIEENEDIKVYTSSVIVLIESPASQPFIGTCSGPICYQQIAETTSFSCFFNGTKPARNLTWEPKSVYSHNQKSVNSKIDENANGTFNSITTLTLTPSKTDLLSLWECKSNWVDPDDNRKIEILVDFSDNDSIKSRYIAKNISAIIGQPLQLQCESIYRICVWKQIRDGTATFLGLNAYGSVIKSEVDNNISFTTNGDIEFSSVEVTHGGLYICMYQEETTVEMKGFYLNVVALPKPFDLVIKGCESGAECTVTKATGSLECSVFGIRPLAQLEWDVDEDFPIKLDNYKETVFSHDDTYDITIKVDYMITGPILCNEMIYISCLASGIPRSYFPSLKDVDIDLGTECVDHTSCSPVNEGGGLLTTTVYLLTSVVVLETLILLALGVRKLHKGYRKRR